MKKILNEAELEKAELLIAGEAVFEKLSNITEDYGNWIVKTYFPYIDEIRKTLGDKIADEWTKSTRDAINISFNKLNKAKEVILNANVNLEKTVKGEETVDFEKPEKNKSQGSDIEILNKELKGENDMYREQINEKWETKEPVIDPEDVGKWKDYSIKELCRLWKNLRKKKNKTPADKEKIAQIVFAIRAKYYGKDKKWGPAKKVCGIKETKTIMEKWGKEVKVDPKEKGKWSKYTVRELCKKYEILKKKKTHTKKDTETLRELSFAIRAKMGWPKGKGPLNICGLEIE